MRKIKRPKVGEYVLVSRYSDKDFNDPWYVGWISEVGEDKRGMFYKCEGNDRPYRHCWRMTKQDGHDWFDSYRSYILGEPF